jgi:uncharacterized protein YlbG (UPF0298 family)
MEHKKRKLFREINEKNEVVINMNEIITKTTRTSKFKQISHVNISHLGKLKQKDNQEVERLVTLISFV